MSSVASRRGSAALTVWLLSSLIVCSSSAPEPAASAPEVIPRSDGAQSDPGKPVADPARVDAPRRRYLSFTIWGWNPNGADLATFRRLIDSAKARGFNTISLAFTWSTIEKSRGRFDFEWLDQRVDYIVEQGLEVQLRVTFTLFPDWIDDRYLMRREDGSVFVGYLFRRGLLSIADSRVREWMERLLRRTVAHYSDRHPGRPVLYYSIPFGPVMETEYAFGAFLDYSPMARDDFREWLRAEYPDIGQLNARWKSSHGGFPAVNVPGAAEYGTAAWADWTRYRTAALKRLFDQLARAVHDTDPAAEIGLQFSENAMRIDSGARGTFDVARLVENVDWVIFEDGPATDHHFSMDLLRTVAQGKRIGQELSPPARLGSPIEGHIQQALVTFQKGGDLVHFANWDWSTSGPTGRGPGAGRISFDVAGAPLNHAGYASAIARVAEEAKKSVTSPDAPRVALYVSTMMQYLHPRCDCPGLRDGVMFGVDTYERVKGTYLRLAKGDSRPVAIITDSLIAARPSLLNRYSEGVYLPAFNRIISDRAYTALAGAEAPLYAENEEVGTLNEYGDSREPAIFRPYPRR